MTRYFTEPRTRKYVKRYEFLSFAKKYNTQLLDAGPNASKNFVHKPGKFLGNKITDAITTSNNNNTEKQKAVDKIIIPLEKIEQILDKLRKVL